MTQRYDVAVVGAGIVGLGHAWAALKRGRSVIVVDRTATLVGSTIRNFGHAGFSMHEGQAAEYGKVAREVWLELAGKAGFWHREAGTLVVARHPDELTLMEEAGVGRQLSRHEVEALAPIQGALGGILAEGDIQVDPREAAPAIIAFLESRGVTFRWRTTAVGVEPGRLRTTRGEIEAETVVVATNYDIDQLFVEIAADFGVERCTLDMMLAEGVGLTVPLLTGSSMLRYSAFASLPQAEAVRERYRAEFPEVFDLDINQMYTERPDGTLVIGDTHQIGPAALPFQSEAAFEVLLRWTEQLFGRPMKVRQRWQGIYAKAPDDFVRVSPMEGVHVSLVTTGIGMTTGLGLAESVIAEIYGE